MSRGKQARWRFFIGFRSLLTVLCALSALGIVFSMPAAWAADAPAYPSKPVRLIVPYAPGGGGDMLARVLAQRLGERWRQPVVVDNRPGAGATIGTDAVAKAPPDGETLLMTAGTIAVTPAAYAKPPYDVSRDFVPITLIAQTPDIVVVNPKVPARTFGELLRMAKANPGQLNYGSPGNGTMSHLAYELLRARLGLQATVVTYKGSNPALLDALAGQVDFVIDTPAAVMSHVRAGKLLPLAVTTAKRSQAAPEVPTLAELGHRDIDVSIWFGLMAPAGTPSSVIGKIYADTKTVMESAPVIAKLEAEGLESVTMEPAAFARFLNAEITRWGALVKQANVRFE